MRLSRTGCTGHMQMMCYSYERRDPLLVCPNHVPTRAQYDDRLGAINTIKCGRTSSLRFQIRFSLRRSELDIKPDVPRVQGTANPRMTGYLVHVLPATYLYLYCLTGVRKLNRSYKCLEWSIFSWRCSAGNPNAVKVAAWGECPCMRTFPI